jgi:acetyl-CoA C-acetyltransferase
MTRPRVALVSAVRTPIGAFGGALRDCSAPFLGSVAIRAALQRASLAGDQVDEVIMGNVYQAGNGPNPARVAAIKADLPYPVPAMTINKVCGSGLKAIGLAAQAIMLGDADCIVAGGMESMSRAPYLVAGARWGERMGHGKLVDVMLQDGLWDCFVDCHMGNTAEKLARQYRVPRDEQDRYALQSQQRYQAARAGNRFADEIVPVEVAQRKGPPAEFTVDEAPRPDTSGEALAGLRPVFEKDGTVTAGNASTLSDGAAAVVVMSEERAAEHGLEPLAWVSGYASAGVDPAIMGIGPAFAIRKTRQAGGRDAAGRPLGLFRGLPHGQHRRETGTPVPRAARRAGPLRAAEPAALPGGPRRQPVRGRDRAGGGGAAQGTAGRVHGRRGAASRHLGRGAGRPAPRVREGWHRHRRQRVHPERRRRRGGGDERGARRRARPGTAGLGERLRERRRRPGHHGHRAGVRDPQNPASWWT